MVKKGEPKLPPTGWRRYLWRAPIHLYRVGLGPLMGKRFLLLNHIGRKTGLPRQAVVEIARYDPEANVYYVASGFGKKSDWYRNLQAHPDVTIQVGNKKCGRMPACFRPKSLPKRWRATCGPILARPWNCPNSWDWSWTTRMTKKSGARQDGNTSLS